MSYIIRTTNGTTLGTILDGTFDNTKTSLTLLGRDYSNYGQVMVDNLVSMVENFANNTPPSNPLQGQLWWDTTNKVLKVYSGTTFNVVNSCTSQPSAPNTPIAGALWWDSSNKQLFVYDGTQPYNVNGWILVGPVFRSADGKSGTIRETILDNLNQPHFVLSIYLDNSCLYIISDDAEFIPLVAINGFTSIRPG